MNSPQTRTQRQIKTLGIMANAGKPAALEVAAAADAYLRPRGVTINLQTRVAEALGLEGRGMSDDAVAESDAVLVLGGDGTILATARMCAPRGTPMLPVHVGRFGFLTAVAPEDLSPALDALLSGSYTEEERLMLWCETHRDHILQDSGLALNEVVIANGPLSRVLHLRTSIDEKYVTTYAADGIIVATPTGSTAYSLSAGGPLVHPSLRTLLVVPICPHTLTARALLIPPDAKVTVVVERDPHDTVRVTIDGQLGFPLQAGDEIHISCAPHPARFLSVGGADFYDKLQNKLHWGETLY